MIQLIEERITHNMENNSDIELHKMDKILTNDEDIGNDIDNSGFDANHRRDSNNSILCRDGVNVTSIAERSIW